MNKITLTIQSLKEAEDVFQVIVNGTLDTYTSKEFSDLLIQCINEGKTKLILNFCNLSHVTGDGVGTLISALDLIKKTNEMGFVKIFGLQKKLSVLFDAMGLIDLFDIYNTLEDVLKDL